MKKRCGRNTGENDMRLQTEAYICKKFANRNKIIKFVITLMRSKGRSMTKKRAQIAFDDVLRQVTEGNEEAFQQLYLHYHDRLFQFARMYLHQQQAAEDVVADLFFQLWKSRGMLGGHRKLQCLYLPRRAQQLYQLPAERLPEPYVRLYTGTTAGLHRSCGPGGRGG